MTKLVSPRRQKLLEQCSNPEESKKLADNKKGELVPVNLFDAANATTFTAIYIELKKLKEEKDSQETSNDGNKGPAGS